MSRNSYPAASASAGKIHDYFARHVAAGVQSGDAPLAALPEAEVIERIVDAAFWTSLRREEGYVPKISLAYLPPEHDTDAIRLERPVPLTPATLAKVAPIVERAGIHLGVWHDTDGLFVWGTTQTIPRFCFVLEVVEPGLLVVKHHRGELSGKFVNVAVLEGDQIKMIDETASSLPDCPTLLTSLLGFDTPASWHGSVNLLVQLAVSMRAHRRGGLLLLVPSDSDRWRASIATPMPYAITPPFRRLTMLMKQTEDEKQPHLRLEVLRETIDAVAGLTAVDGATILNERYELLAFGAKIVRRKGSSLVERVTITEPIEGGVASIVTPPELGGTRHLSAAQFVYDQRDAVALVASQDGRFTVLAWSPCADGVHAHRVEALLL